MKTLISGVHSYGGFEVGCYNDVRNEWFFYWWPQSYGNSDTYTCQVKCDGFRYFGLGVISQSGYFIYVLMLKFKQTHCGSCVILRMYCHTIVEALFCLQSV